MEKTYDLHDILFERLHRVVDKVNCSKSFEAALDILNNEFFGYYPRKLEDLIREKISRLIHKRNNNDNNPASPSDLDNIYVIEDFSAEIFDTTRDFLEGTDPDVIEARLAGE